MLAVGRYVVVAAGSLLLLRGEFCCGWSIVVRGIYCCWLQGIYFTVFLVIILKFHTNFLTPQNDTSFCIV